MEKGFMKASDIAEELDISISYAYRIVRMLNEELSNMGYITITGRVNRQYFNERLLFVKQTITNPKPSANTSLRCFVEYTQRKTIKPHNQ